MNKQIKMNAGFLRYIIIGVFSIFLLNSCKKGNADLATNPGAGVSYVGIVHASAGSPALDFAFDNNRAGVNYFNYTDRVNYLNVFPGNRNFKVYIKGSPAGNPVKSKDLSFAAGKHYTVFIADTAANMDAVIVRDSTRSALGDSLRLRFANMSPDAPALDLYEKGNPTPIATNISYKTAGNFFSFPSKANVVFEIRQNGQTALLATADAVNLYRGYAYTVWCGGYKNGSDAAGTRIRLETFSH